MADALADFLRAGDFPPPPVDYVPGTLLAMYGFTDGSIPQEEAAVCLTFSANSLFAEGLMHDHDLFSRADGDQQKLWELGDAFEFMFQLPGQVDYHEFQTSPNGFRLQLHIGDCQTFRTVPHEKKLCDLDLKAFHSYDFAHRLWRVKMELSLSTLGVTRQDLSGARFVFVRQNHGHNTEKPEITASRIFHHTAHDPTNWHRIV